MPVRLGAAVIAEFLGTFALCFVGMLAIHHASAASGGLVLVALAHGLILSTMVSATLPTSGGHLNPAVTFSFLVTGKIKPGAAVAYVVSQLVGGIVAGLAVWAIFGAGEDGARVVWNGTPQPTVAAWTAVLAELITTGLLVLAVWGSAADPRAKNVGGFAIGLTVAADILAIGPLTGASMNPARSFGPTFVAAVTHFGSAAWSQHWIYWLGPLVGGGIVGILYHLILWPRDTARHIDPGAADVPPTQRPAGNTGA